MDNFDFKKYVTEGRIHQDVSVISEDKKQGYDDREDESLGARKGAEKGKKQSMKDRRDDSYGKFGKRDAEAKGKKKGPGKNKVNKESVEVDEGFEDVVDDIMDQGKSREDAEKIARAINRDYVGNYRQEEGYGKKYEEDDSDAMKEDARTDAEQEGYKDGFDDAKDDIEGALKKMKVSELKAKIRETILSELEGDEVNEEEEVDVDIDVEDEVEVEAGADDIEIERPGVKAKVQVGLSPEEEIVQDSLKAAMDAADALGNDKLADQIGNTITFFTREYVVGRNSD